MTTQHTFIDNVTTRGSPTVIAEFTETGTYVEELISTRPHSEQEILGATTVWIYLCVRALQGLAAILGNLVTIVAVIRYEFLWENCTSRIVASLGKSSKGKNQSTLSYFGTLYSRDGISVYRYS